MDFFEHQDQARKRTRQLVVYFVIAVVATMVAVYLATALGLAWLAAPSAGSAEAFAGSRDLLHHSSNWLEPLWDGLPFDAELLLLVFMATGLIVALGSSVKTFQLSKGGPAVAALLGGKPVSQSTTNPREKQLLNVVEEMAIASGVPAPQVFLLEEETAVNAFAAGFSQADATIGVTRGTMELLSRDELQGVIAHEFSHILNGDMRLNLQMTCLTHGILFIASTGMILLRLPFRVTFAVEASSSNSRRGGMPPQILLAILAVGAVLTAIGSVGYFSALLLKSAVSRQREFLADAAAVQFTRNPEGIGGALKKIGGLSHGSRLRASQASEASHFFFANGLSAYWWGGLASHPPLSDRIRQIDPHFDGTFPKVKALDPTPIGEDGSYQKKERELPGVFTRSPGTSQIAGLVAAAGTVTPAALEAARQMTEALPAELRQACNEAFGARAVAYGLLLSPDAQVLAHQESVLKNQADPAVLQELENLRAPLRELPERLRLVMVDLAIPALRELSAEQYGRFREIIHALATADQVICLFEYCLEKVLLKHLDPVFGTTPPKKPTRHSLIPVWNECRCLLGALAYLESETYEEAGAAFAAGIGQLNIADRDTSLPPQEETGLAAVDQALDTCAGLTPMHKRNLLFACSQVVLHLRGLDSGEAQLLRAIADTLDCPLPPFVTDTLASQYSP